MFKWKSVWKSATLQDFPGGPVVKNLFADAGSIFGWGTTDKIPCATM